MDRTRRVPAVPVAEDNPITRKLIRIAPSAEGYKVREVLDGPAPA